MASEGNQHRSSKISCWPAEKNSVRPSTLCYSESPPAPKTRFACHVPRSRPSRALDKVTQPHFEASMPQPRPQQIPRRRLRCHLCQEGPRRLCQRSLGRHNWCRPRHRTGSSPGVRGGGLLPHGHHLRFRARAATGRSDDSEDISRDQSYQHPLRHYRSSGSGRFLVRCGATCSLPGQYGRVSFLLMRVQRSSCARFTEVSKPLRESDPAHWMTTWNVNIKVGELKYRDVA
jgi:hypothetical protein